MHAPRPGLAAALALAVAGGCQWNEHQTVPEESLVQPSSPTRATVDRMQETPGKFFGREVRLTGEVDHVLSDRAFTLEGTGWAFGDDITVLTRTPVRFADNILSPDDELVVTGVVRSFAAAEVEPALGWDVEPELEALLKARPVVVATSIRRVTTFGADATWNATDQDAPPIFSVVTIVATEDPGALAGRPVDLRRERVRERLGRGLWIGPSQKAQVFVVPAALPPGIQPGDFVEVRGTLRGMPRNPGKAWDVPAQATEPLLEEALYIDATDLRVRPTQRPGA
ncbi:hypothetical protein [Nannocystis pusilla]|uniref:DUF5666 domain-containing protein n=1 Tax=Nannocystis pusilla TaxID=889268 RepID=A0ABS7U573_9BACT|nr:hypothetical protein [Nannocystis pusilla]MBZ5715709.1 hypothetical protein [Nannocystis pusilla]